MAITQSSDYADQVKTAYDRVALMALRLQTQFDALVTFKSGDPTNPGTPVQFTFLTDMAVNTGSLTEDTDVTPVTLADTNTTVTPAEHGAAIGTTIKLRTDSFLRGFDASQANLIGYNMVNSIDVIARTAFDAAGTAKAVNSSGAGSNAAGDTLTVALIRQQHAALAKAAVIPWDGTNFVSLIHPDVAYDVKAITGDTGWVVPVRYNDAVRIYNNEIGTLAGFRFIETARTLLAANGGSGSVDNYTTYFLGSQAMAKAESIAPSIVLSPQTDLLRRFQHLGWYGYFGYGELYSAALIRMVSASSIGDNS